jgi:hypothetical protein
VAIGGILPIIIPKPIGIKSKGSASLDMPTYIRTAPIMSIMMLPNVKEAKPLLVTKKLAILCNIFKNLPI